MKFSKLQKWLRVRNLRFLMKLWIYIYIYVSIYISFALYIYIYVYIYIYISTADVKDGFAKQKIIEHPLKVVRNE